MVKRLLKEVKEYKKASILAPLCVTAQVVMELLIPFFMGLIVDKGIYQRDFKNIFFYGGLMLLFAGLALVFGFLGGHYSSYASAGFVKNLRNAMFEKIQTFSFANMDKFSTGGFVTRMMTDATNIQSAYQMSLRLLVRAPLMLIMAMFMTFYINSELAIIFLVAAIFLAISLGYLMYKVNPIFKSAFERYDDLNSVVQENVSNIRVVKSYVKEEDEKNKFFDAASNLKKIFMKAENYLVLNAPIMRFTMYASTLALSWFGAHVISYGNMTTGELMSMFTYTNSILRSLMMISRIFVMLSMSVASGTRIMEVLNEVPSIVNPENPVTEIINGDIEFEDVSFGYYQGKDKYVLNNINLKINSGEMIGILGSTGSSKTTLVNLIPRLYDTSEGVVKVGGIDVRDYDLKALRDEVSVVLQRNLLFSGTVIENLRWGNKDATLKEVTEAATLASANHFIEAMPGQYEGIVEQGGMNFSGGQKQRLTIARALLKNPKILILDDSTSAVDTNTDLKIRQALKTTHPNTTKLIISQRISSIEDADRILVMDEGTITGIGTHQELLKTNKLYQDVYETQKRGDA